jgi:mono/diheme cytochrome c family protein
LEFPIFQVPYLGNGMTIALNAVLHVVISHGVSIGVTAMIILGEYLGLRRSSPHWETFSKSLLKPTIIIITGVGAVTGVGIWFITSVLSPRSIGSLLRVFFWPWFIEWIIFTCEVVVILIYYFTWDKWTGQRKKRHVYLGASYVLLALASAFIITGILGFMLTSDNWPWSKNFWSGFFNPSFPPQLFLRIAGSFALGALFSMAFLLFTAHDSPFREKALTLFSRITLVCFFATIGFSWWYFSIVPSVYKTNIVFSVLSSRFSQYPEFFWYANTGGAILFLLLMAFGLRGRIHASKILIIPVIIISIGFTAEFERIREFVRGPYLIPGYMYSNQVLLAETPFFDQTGALKSAYWYDQTVTKPDVVSQGAYLFARNCSSCHTIGGINDIRARFEGRPEDGILVILKHTHEMVPFMPPFSGTDDERQTLGRFLYQLSNKEIEIKPLSRFTAVQNKGTNE